jgi:hypothetical protein
MAGNFYFAVLAKMFSYSEVPPPARLGEWIESQTWEPHALPKGTDPGWPNEMAARLRNWPQNEPYPLVPDDEMMLEARSNPEVTRGWWVPGTRRGDLGAATARAIPRIP